MLTYQVPAGGGVDGRYRAAKRYLEITWSGEPSRFLAELGIQAPSADPTMLNALKAWRLQRARRDEVPAYVVFHDTTLEEIARRRPRELWELGRSLASARRSSSATAPR